MIQCTWCLKRVHKKRSGIMGSVHNAHNLLVRSSSVKLVVNRVHSVMTSTDVVDRTALMQPR